MNLEQNIRGGGTEQNRYLFNLIKAELDIFLKDFFFKNAIMMMAGISLFFSFFFLLMRKTETL